MKSTELKNDFLYKLMSEMTSVFESSKDSNELILGLKQVFKRFFEMLESAGVSNEIIIKTMDYTLCADGLERIAAKEFNIPTIERKMAIITAHTGISKKEQMTMTLRSHSLLFEEVSGEVDFTTIRPVALFSGKGADMEHWIYRKKKNKFDKYITQVDDYAKSMGAGKNIKSSDTSLGDLYTNQFNNFTK